MTGLVARVRIERLSKEALGSYRCVRRETPTAIFAVSWAWLKCLRLLSRMCHSASTGSANLRALQDHLVDEGVIEYGDTVQSLGVE